MGPCGACGGISRATSEPSVAGRVGRPDDVDWTVELAGGTDDVCGAVEAGCGLAVLNGGTSSVRGVLTRSDGTRRLTTAIKSRCTS